MRVIDLFSGCGGLSLGFQQSGYHIEQAVEFDPVIANTYQKNHPDVEVIVDDIKHLDDSGFFAHKAADIIIGGPPCQGFSMAGARIRRGFFDDPRNYLFRHYFHIVKVIKPQAFVMENVTGMLTMQDGAIFKQIVQWFSDSDWMEGKPYRLYHRMVQAVEFGIPQKRERLILIAARKDVDFDELWEQTRAEITQEYPTYFNAVTIRDAIGNLPSTSKDGLVRNPIPLTAYEKYLSCKAEMIANHTQSNHAPIVVERMKKIGNGENFTVLDEKIKSVHSGSYGRLCWEEPAATITTRFDTPTGGRFIHPAENRTLSPREAARIQSFPDDFIFYGDKRSISRQIGNAVPPKISYFLARLLTNILKDENG